MSRYSPSLFLLLIPFLEGCCRYEACQPDKIGVTFRNYSPAELSTVILRRYDTIGFYQHLLDTIVVPADFNTGGTGEAALINRVPYGGYNWEVALPAAGRTVRLFNLTYDNREIRSCEQKVDICFTPIKSFIQDSLIELPTGNAPFAAVIAK